MPTIIEARSSSSGVQIKTNEKLRKIVKQMAKIPRKGVDTSRAMKRLTKISGRRGKNFGVYGWRRIGDGKMFISVAIGGPSHAR